MEPLKKVTIWSWGLPSHPRYIQRFQGCSHRVSLARILPQGSISLANKGYMSMERAMRAVRVCAFPKIIGVSPSSFLTMCARDTLGEPTEICINWVVDLDFPDTYMKFSAFTKQFACAAISAELWAIFSAFCWSLVHWGFLGNSDNRTYVEHLICHWVEHFALRPLLWCVTWAHNKETRKIVSK